MNHPRPSELCWRFILLNDHPTLTGYAIAEYGFVYNDGRSERYVMLNLHRRPRKP
jgi:hypothetical protein